MFCPANLTNPFKQSKAIWLVELSLPFGVMELFADNLAGFASSVSCFEEQASASFESRPEDIWTLQLYCETKPEELLLGQKIALLAAHCGIVSPVYSLEIIPDQDWVSQVQENFPPIHVGRYFVHGGHYRGRVPQAANRLQIDAGRAFGTGEHETTSACLEAITWLAKRRRFSRMLDMGCGSGILAIAMVQAWKQPVTAVDIDEQAVCVARKNMAINRVSAYITTGVSNGYRSRLVGSNAPYDLIASNILAKPLVAFAPLLAKNLAPQGVCILSGLLKYQEPAVLSTHLQQGLRLIKRIERNRWSTLVLGKG